MRDGVATASGTIAITRAVSPTLADCELTHIAREPIDLARAVAQHAAYEAALATLGCRVVRAPDAPGCPDAVFIEDTAVVTDEVAVITRPGAASRRGESAAVAALLATWRPVVTLTDPATLDGGDVLVVGRAVFVGLSSRTNREGLQQLGAALAPHGYVVRGVPVAGVLHLKTAATALDDHTVLVNPAWVDPTAFAPLTAIPVDPGEPGAANVVRVGTQVLVAAAFPRTAQRLRDRGYAVTTVPADELAKAEGALTCCSLLLRDTEAVSRGL
ncbi:MAG: dimethylargininase [Gemmatimonadetes bacterium]|nr:dimethylargininase [Gemmatimonadota bacterium]